jgi:hypothetical protein
MANGNGSEPGYSPLWYAVGAIVLIGLMMGTILVIKPLEFKPPVVHCEEAACTHGATSAEPEGVSHEHEAAPAEHHEGH